MSKDIDITVTSFYRGTSKHPHYGSIHQIHRRLLSPASNIFQETDFIAWLFPWIKALDEDSTAPLITSADLEQFRRHYELRRLFNRSMQLVLSYYGLELRINEIQASTHFAEAAGLWLMPPNPIYLQRLHPIIQSITLLGEKQSAHTMLEVLTRTHQAFPHCIDSWQLQQWQQAIRQGEREFYLLFDQPMYNYQQFWQRGSGDKILSIKQLLFSQAENATTLIALMKQKGFHSTRVNQDINTLTPYPRSNKVLVYLTPGQMAICYTLSFHLPNNPNPLTGKELIELLLEDG